MRDDALPLDGQTVIAMEKLKDILWPIVAIGGLGAFIDFLIGKAGQEKAKDFLLKWWVRFDDVHWKNFGREEGLVTGRFLEEWLGQRTWGARRILVAIQMIIVIIIVCYVKSVFGKYDLTCIYCNGTFYFGGIVFVMTIAGFCLSTSFTIWLTFLVANLCGIGQSRNIIILIALLIFNSLLFVYWFEITEITSYIITMMLFYIATFTIFVPLIFLNAVPPGALIAHVSQAKELLKWGDFYYSNELHSFVLGDSLMAHKPIEIYVIDLISIFPSVLRFILLIVFIGSFLLKPLVMHPVSLVWARIIESEKPVFTLTFGGVAAFATAISEAAKHL
jgi:hypothetical protein